MKTKHWQVAAAIAAPLASQQALAAPTWGDPVEVGGDLAIDPIVEGRLRYEGVDQPAAEADAVTLRFRAGAEFKRRRLSILAEAEGTLAIAETYNAFPFAVPDRQRRPQYAVVPDPMSIELNRLQLQYRLPIATVTLGRQRINLDDQRWVGSVGWRQNEQTFDAVRGQAKVGAVTMDATYAIGQRTIFGVDAGPRQAHGGDFFLGGAALKAGPIEVKAFAYVIDYDEVVVRANSSKTFGFRAAAALPLSSGAKLNLAASYARQSDHGGNPFDYAADYVAAEGGIAYKGLTVGVGYELLGADASAAPGGRAVQTPLATLHKFNGWADVFLSTPGAGLQDFYGSIAYRFDGVKLLPGLNAAATYHRYDSDIGDLRYGAEWNASVGFRIGSVSILAKYADYQAKGFGVDTTKAWLQAEFAY